MSYKKFPPPVGPGTFFVASFIIGVVVSFAIFH